MVRTTRETTPPHTYTHIILPRRQNCTHQSIVKTLAQRQNQFMTEILHDLIYIYMYIYIYTIYYTTIIPSILVYEVMQDFYHQQ